MPDNVETLTIIEHPTGDVRLAFGERDCSGVDGQARGHITLPEPMTLPEVGAWIADDNGAEDHLLGQLTHQEVTQVRRDVRQSAWFEGDSDADSEIRY